MAEQTRTLLLLTRSERAEAAYDAYYGLLHYVVAQKFGVRDENEIRGIIHDVFIAFMRNEAKIGRSPEDERSWLVACACNCCRYYWRKHQGAELPAEIGTLIDPSKVAEEAEARLDVAGVLCRISERCQSVLRLRYAEGRSPNEIAEGQALTRGSAKNLISKCLRAARGVLRRLQRWKR